MKTGKRRSFLHLVLWILAATSIAACLGSLQIFANGLNRISDGFQLDTAPQASLVYDRDGRVVFSFASEDRTDVPLDQISPAMVSAVLAAEDRSFFKHAGLDIVGLGRAAWVDLRAGAAKQGGSTITQQLVRLVALTRDRTVERKIRETLLALRIDRRFQKEQILQAYLNRIYLGDGHYGVEAAARGYFGKRASELTAAEGAMLAGLIKCPSTCSPRVAPALAKRHRDVVLRNMREAGAMTPQAYEAAVSSPISLIAEAHDANFAALDGDVCGLYFMESVRREVMARYGAADVLRGGLRIYTTVDMKLQKQAEEAIRVRLGELDKTGQLEGALVALDPHTGDVLAIVGGRDFHQTSFNRALQARRQPGSAFKPLLFAAAIEQGYSPSSQITGLDTPINTPQGAWLPSGEHEAASYTLRRALTVSSNRAAVRLMQMVGIGTTQTYARRLGISSPMPSVPSLALGTAEVSLADLTSAYGAFANDGVVAPHTLITRIEDRYGRVIWESTSERHPYRAVRPGTAFLMSSMMADVMNRGTGTGARAVGFTLPAAGKTGTTDDYGDAWFIGYTPHLVTGVWFGYDERKKIMNRGFAATVAVPAWARFMKQATEGATADWFAPPTDVEKIKVCRLSGERAGAACAFEHTDDGSPNVYEDYFLIGTGPYDICPGHAAPAPLDSPGGGSTTTALSALF